MGEKPDYSGQVSTLNQKKIGTIALWKNDKEKDNQPDYTGTVSFYNGKKRFRIAVWSGDEKQEVEESKDTLPKFYKD